MTATDPVRPTAGGLRVFHLSYLSRSGSTLLARLLQERYRVCVTPEGSLPAEMLGVNGFAPPRFADAAAAEAYLRSVVKMSKLGDWGLDLRAAAARAGPWPADGIALFRTLLAEWRDARSPGDEVVVYKGDPVMPWELSRALDAHPGAGAILVVRDPRAVLHSQRTSRYAYAGGAFSHSVAHTAWEWRKLSEAALAQDGRRAVLRYEDLVRDEAGTLAQVAAFLGAEARDGAPAPDFLAGVAAAERHLHVHVNEAPKPERAERWRRELDPRAADLIQEMLREEMPAMGYALEQGRRPGRLAILGSRLRWRLGAARAEVLRRGRQVAADPGYVLGKAAARVRGLRAGRSA